MKIFVLIGTYFYGTNNVVGVYDTEEKAAEAQQIFDEENEGLFYDYLIQEFIVNEPAGYNKGF
jgi:hypothetical protein